MQQAIDAVQAEHPDATIELVRHGDLLARFDPDAMARAVRHLVATAVAHADGDRVGVRVDGSAPDRIWIEVATLRAIPPDAQERLMGPPRARAGREQPGLALGLHAIEETVRAHAASVAGRSKAPEGTVFELLLPRDARAT